MNSFQEKVSFIWSLADLLRGDYKQSEYGNVILPFTVLRRLDSLANSTGITFSALAKQPDRLLHYIGGFSSEVRDIFECFGFARQIARLKRSGLLSMLINRFCEIDLQPQTVSNHEMGTIFEELIRKFAEQSNETAGEHFTPREVIHLMVRLVFGEDCGDGKTLYDPACGTGGMLSIADEFVRQQNPAARLECYGQELNPESYAIARADALLRGQEIRDIAPGNSFTQDGFAGRHFDYMLSNPPFGVEWKKVERQIREENERLGFAGRFGAGLPRVSDGSLLFLQQMLSKTKPEGSRIAVVFNGSPLFAGDAGAGESAIRKWIIENDWLEAVIALPDQLFYNTGLATYIWLLANQKPAERKGKVQLINAVSFAERMRRSLGAKRNQIPPASIDEICGIHREFRQSRHSRILRNEELGYRRLIVERPLRLSFQATAERIRSLEGKCGPAVLDVLTAVDPSAIYRDQTAFDAALSTTFRRAGLKLGRTLARRIREALSQQDDGAEIYRDAKGRPLPDAALRDSEDVPLDQKVDLWFEREVRPHAPDAWIAPGETPIGYAIPFARFFFEAEPVRSLDEIDREIRDLEQETQALLEKIHSA
ncbi:MAG: type I restriction-modification system subunit M [Acidobacteriia bacterium]|nr:type I restriction-modification system subunit M [Terriglobia bacterium]